MSLELSTRLPTLRGRVQLFSLCESLSGAAFDIEECYWLSINDRDESLATQIDFGLQVDHDC